MSWASNLFNKHERNLHFAAVLLLALVLVIGWPRKDGQPVINTSVSNFISTTLYYPFNQLKNNINGLKSVAAERDKLLASLVETSSKLQTCAEIERENARLRAALGFEPPPSYRLIPARVTRVSMFGQPIPRKAVINKGVKDAIIVNQAVINQDGLIGRIESASNDIATIQLLTDPSNRVAARVARSREMGIVKYLVKGEMILDNFPKQDSINVGDTIISSGLGGSYPPGLLIGTVVSVSRSKDSPFCRIILDPAVNFRSLEEVFVLQRVHP
jgi:rod shape-determining protein MreC